MAPPRTPNHRTPRSSISSTTAFLTPQTTPAGLPSPAVRSAPSSGPRLILVHDDDDDSGDDAELAALPLPDEVDDEHESEQAAQAFTLSPGIVLLYLVSSSVRLGASLLSDLESHVSWKIVIPVMAVVAAVFAATVQVWTRMARYVRRSTLADVVADAVVGLDAGVKSRKAVRSAVKICGIVSNVLLCSVYMRVFLDALLQLYSDDVGYALRVPVTLCLALFASLCMGSTLRSKRVIFTTAVSVTCYVLAIAASSFLRIKNIPWPDPPSSEARSLAFRIWESTSIILFTFATPFVLPLYSVLARPTTIHSDRKKHVHSFTGLSISALAIALILLVPLVFVSPGAYRSKNPQASSPHYFSPAVVQQWIIFLRAFAVAAATPSVMCILPTPNSNAFGFGVRSRRLVWQGSFLGLMTVIALLPVSGARAARGCGVALSLAGSYLLPVLLHVAHHHLRRPQAIIVPLDTESEEEGRSESQGLLLRKEHTLQRRRLARRIIWDLAVWLILLPLSITSIAWAAGYATSRW